MTNYLIAGGFGLIGSNLVEQLYRNTENHIFVVDNFSTSRLTNLSPEILQSERLKYIQLDIQNLKQDTLNMNLDYVVNLASRASPKEFSKNPLEILTSNSTGTKKLLDLAMKNNAKFFYASTSEIYGNPRIHPQPEDYYGNVNTLGPRSCYNEGKRFGEALTYTYVEDYCIDATIGRIFNTYGTKMRMDDGRVIPTFLQQAMNDRPITINGDGLQTRSFCHVDDLVSAILLLLHGETSHLVYNIGNPEEITIKYLAELIIELTNSHSGITYHGLPQDDPRRRCPDISRITKEFGWKPKISTRYGLSMVVSDIISTKREVNIID